MLEVYVRNVTVLISTDSTVFSIDLSMAIGGFGTMDNGGKRDGFAVSTVIVD